MFKTINQPSLIENGISGTLLLDHLHYSFSNMQIFEATGDNLLPLIQLGRAHPYLLHSMLSMAASHLRYKYETADSTINSQQIIVACRVAEHAQQAVAIGLFREAFSKPITTTGRADALIFTTMILNLLAFSMDNSYTLESTWIFSNNPKRLDWFSLQLGLKSILLHTTAYREESVLSWIFQASDDENSTFHNRNQQPLTNVPFHWLRLCGLDHNGDTSNLFYEPVRVLAELRNIEASPSSFLLYTSFFGKLDERFRDLLLAGDERAMWLLGYWYRLLSRFKLNWWLYKYVSMHSKAVVVWLETKGARTQNAADSFMWRQLLADLEQADVNPNN